MHTRIPEELELNPSTGWFIGAYLAEGTHTEGGIIITNSDETYRSRAIKFAESLNLNHRIDYSEGEYGPSISVQIRSSILAKLFGEMCGTHA